MESLHELNQGLFFCEVEFHTMCVIQLSVFFNLHQ